ncbi:hypothetical protein QQ045_003790 [Rhodiola kirilowii]
MQDPSMTSQPQNGQKPSPHPPFGNPNLPFRGAHHRRAHSEVSFRIPDDLDLISDPFDAPSGSFEELGSEDDLFCTYMDIEKFGSKIEDGGPSNVAVEEQEGYEDTKIMRQHRYSNSIDGSSMMDSIEAKKAMAPDKLAELWTVDPKRAKRILANRQSAARSKERKSRYIIELERNVQTLQTTATTLSAQLTLYQRDTTGLSSENTALKIRYQAMEQQTQLHDALNEALKKEVQRLKMATGDMMTSSDSYNFGMHQIPYNQSSSFFPHQAQAMPTESRNAQMQQYHHMQPSMSPHRSPPYTAAQAQAFSDMLQQDSLGRMQGLDINGRVSHLVKSEGLSVSASESSSTL